MHRKFHLKTKEKRKGQSGNRWPGLKYTNRKRQVPRVVSSSSACVSTTIDLDTDESCAPWPQRSGQCSTPHLSRGLPCEVIRQVDRHEKNIDAAACSKRRRWESRGRLF